MQQRAALWILGVFHTLPTASIEAISYLIPIYLHLKKLYGRFYFRGSLLLLNHIFKSIINSDGPNNHTKHCLSLNDLMPKQVSHLNSLLIDMNNRCNKFLPLFSLFNKEFFPGNCFIDIFQFSNTWCQELFIQTRWHYYLSFLWSFIFCSYFWYKHKEPYCNLNFTCPLIL